MNTPASTANALVATPDNFENLVIGNSMKGLVLVHYWTPKAGPCLHLNPKLHQLAAHYGGRFLLVLANTDELGPIARAQGVNSVPTVKFYLHGEAVHTIHGNEPERTFHAALSRYLAGESDQLRQSALRAHQAGQTDQAISLLARAATENPEDLAVAADLAKLLTLAGQPAEALALLAALPAEARRDGRIAPLLAHLELIDAAEHGPEDEDTDTPEVALTRAARALFDNQTEAALEGLLALAQTAPDFRQDIGRRALLALFEMLGAEHPLTRPFRARLAAIRG